MEYSGHRKLLCELSKLSKLNAENTQQQLTSLALLPCSHQCPRYCIKRLIVVTFTGSQAVYLGLRFWLNHAV